MVPASLDVVTRRRALALGAAAGLGALVRAPADGWAAPSARARSFTLDVPASAWARGGGRTTAVLRAPRRFDLLGLRARGLARAGVEVRVRSRGGAWSPWTPLGVGAEHGPDVPRVDGASDPVWSGGADELQLRARRVPAGAQVHFVSVPRTARRAGARIRAAHAAQAGGPPTIVTRAEWGGDGVPPRAAPLYGDVQMAFVHHTVSANEYAAGDSAAIVLAIAKYHRDTNGWNDIGYNLLVDQFGQVFEGRAGGIEAAVVGAQAQGWNSHSTGIATIGTWSDVAFPEAGLAALTRVLAWKLGLHGVPATGTVALVSAGGSLNRYRAGVTVTFEHISGHRDGCSTSCPGDQLYAQLPGLRGRVAALGGVAAVQPKLTLAPASVQVAYGSGATFAGGLRGTDGRGVPGAGVLLQKQGSSGWVTVGRTVTGGDGDWSVTVRWRRAGAIRALATVPGHSLPLRSAPVSVGITSTLDVSPGAGRVLAGRAAVLTGHVRPGGPVRVRIERQTAGGRWVRVGDVPARVRGTRWAVRPRLERPGIYRLTVRAGTTARPVLAPARFVRAVRHPADVDKVAGGSPSRSVAAQPGGAGA